MCRDPTIPKKIETAKHLAKLGRKDKNKKQNTHIIERLDGGS